MIFRSTISSSDRSFRAYLDKWRNETGRLLFASLGDRSNVSSPRIENCQVAGRKKDQGSFDIFGHVSHSSTSPSSLYCRLAERTLSRKLLNRRRFPRSTSSSSSSSSSSSLSRIERRDAREGKGKPNGMLRHGFDKRQDERSDALRLPRTNVHVETETRGVPPSFPPDLASTLLKGRRRRRRRW